MSDAALKATVQVNGRAEPLEVATVAELLRRRGLDPDGRGLAVAINGAVAPRAAWVSTRLNAGDAIEIVQAKQGG
jgi:sulfur carrier protein